MVENRCQPRHPPSKTRTRTHKDLKTDTVGGTVSRTVPGGTDRRISPCSPRAGALAPRPICPEGSAQSLDPHRSDKQPPSALSLVLQARPPISPLFVGPSRGGPPKAASLSVHLRWRSRLDTWRVQVPKTEQSPHLSSTNSAVAGDFARCPRQAATLELGGRPPADGGGPARGAGERAAGPVGAG